MKIIPGAIVGKISGSLGGMTASHGRGGYYLRNRVKPVNSNTTRQQDVRSALGSLVQGWSSLLTPGQRAAWTAYANATPRKDRLGENLILTGSQAYVACNTPRLQVSASSLTTTLARLDDAPVTPTLGEPITEVSMTLSAGPLLAIDASLQVPSSDAGNVLVFVGTRLMSAGQLAYRGPYQLATTLVLPVDDNAATQASVDPTDPAEWAAGIQPADGDQIAVRAVVSYDDGRLSQEWRGLVTVETGP